MAMYLRKGVMLLFSLLLISPSYLITARQNGGLLIPHTASLRCEAGVFLSMLILLPSTYNSRSAWEVSEQERHHPLPALRYFKFLIYSQQSSLQGCRLRRLVFGQFLSLVLSLPLWQMYLMKPRLIPSLSNNLLQIYPLPAQ